jgi:uncharacterized protein (TIGR00645 family)
VKALLKSKQITNLLGDIVFFSRWVLYPINLWLIIQVCFFAFKFLANKPLEESMVNMLGAVDASMIVNLLIMIIQGGHQIFIQRFEDYPNEVKPQWLDHIDSGLLKVKVALSITGITLVRVLKDFVNIESSEFKWELTKYRLAIHLVCLFSAVVMALIWRITHPRQEVKHG